MAATGRSHFHGLDRRWEGRQRRWCWRQRWWRWRWRADLDVGAANARRCSICAPVLVPSSASTPSRRRIHPPDHVTVGRRHKGVPPLRGATMAVVGCWPVLHLIDKVGISCLRPVREAAAALSLATGKRGRARRVNVRTATRPTLVFRQHPDIVGRRRRRWRRWRRRWGWKRRGRRRVRRPVQSAVASEAGLGTRTAGVKVLVIVPSKRAQNAKVPVAARLCRRVAAQVLHHILVVRRPQLALEFC